jgi:hypothetical protein
MPVPGPEDNAGHEPGECQQSELASLRAQAVQSREDAAASVAAARQHATAQIARARQRAASKVTEAERRAAAQVADAKRRAAEAEQQADEARRQAADTVRQAADVARRSAEQAEKEVASARHHAELEVARARQQAESEVARLHQEARTDMETMWQQVVAATQAYDEQSDELARALAGLREPGDFGTDLDTVEHETARRRLAQVELSLASERAAWAARDAQTVLHVKQLEDALAWWDSHHAEQRAPDASSDEVESDRGNLTKSDTVNLDETEPGTSKCTSHARESTPHGDEDECAHDEEGTNDDDTDGRKSDCVEPATVERMWTRRTASGNEQAARTKHKYAVVPINEPEQAGQVAQSMPSSKPRGPRPHWRPAVPDRIDEEDEEEDEDEDEGEDEGEDEDDDQDEHEDHQQTREHAREDARVRARARAPDNGAITALKRKR